MAPSDNQVTRVLLSSWLFAGLSALFLGLRIGCKLKSKRGLWLDDYILIVSWVRPSLLGITFVDLEECAPNLTFPITRLRCWVRL